MHYIYTNYGSSWLSWSQPDHGVIFECDGEDILDADKQFTAAIGQKMSHKKCTSVATWSPQWTKK